MFVYDRRFRGDRHDTEPFGGFGSRRRGGPQSCATRRFRDRGLAVRASFERQGRIEQQTAAGWETVFHEFSLVEDCGAVAALPACVTLAPGAVLRPVPWNGYSCYGQCPRACKKNVYRPPGTFRLVLTVCGGGEQVVGTPFFMGPRAKQ